MPTQEDIHQGAEAAGLGVLAAPYVHKMLGGSEASRLGHMLHHPATELTGLGILAAPAVAHFGKKLLPGKAAAPKEAAFLSPQILSSFFKEAKVLSDAEREKLPAKAFAVSTRLAKKSHDEIPAGEKGKYPIPDEAHARNALARVAQHGTPSEQEAVRAKVRAKFPQIDVGEHEKKAVGPADAAERALWLGRLAKNRLARLSTAAADPLQHGVAQRLAERTHGQLSTLGHAGAEIAQGWRSGQGQLSGRLHEGTLRKIHEGLQPHQELLRPSHLRKSLAKAEDMTTGGHVSGYLKPRHAVFRDSAVGSDVTQALPRKFISADAPTQLFEQAAK